MIKIENWCGYDIRFIEQDGEWWAILKDICDALHLHTFKVAQRLDSDMLIRVPIEIDANVKRDDTPSRHNVSKVTKTFHMLAVNE